MEVGCGHVVQEVLDQPQCKRGHVERQGGPSHARAHVFADDAEGAMIDVCVCVCVCVSIHTYIHTMPYMHMPPPPLYGSQHGDDATVHVIDCSHACGLVDHALWHYLMLVWVLL